MSATYPFVAATTFVVTRPRGDSEAMVAWLTAHGATAFNFPVMSIAAIVPAPDAARLTRARAIIFVSSNAVRHGLAWLRASGGLTPAQLIYAIGPTTAAALVDAGVAHVQTAEAGADSEAMLALATLQDIAGHQILIIKGDSVGGGRHTLRESLQQRGAHVDELICYVRAKVMLPPVDIHTLVTKLAEPVPVVFFALSVETLDSLVANLGQVIGWQSALFLVPHARVAAAAQAHGVRHIAVVPVPLTAAIEPLEKIMQHFITQS